LWIANSQTTIVVNFHQDFMDSKQSNIFKGQMDRGLIYWPNQSGETRLPNQEEEQDEEEENGTAHIYVKNKFRKGTS